MGSTGKSSCGGCAICGAPVAPRGENPGFPFCSERCRTIDLGQWLDERYRIPTTERPDDDPGADDN
jgi:endogenous inhibitor of DNA gyrase (YacG/DUF329 family)